MLRTPGTPTQGTPLTLEEHSVVFSGSWSGKLASVLWVWYFHHLPEISLEH